MVVCEKCQDRGFIEENHGLIVILCDCEKGKEYRAQREAILGIPKAEVDDEPKYLIIPKPIEGKTIDETAEIAREIIKASRNDSSSRTESANPNLGSPDTSEPKQPSKPKKKKKPRKRAK